jgi:hypothetical protein
MLADSKNTNVEEATERETDYSINPDKFPDESPFPVPNEDIHKNQLKKIVEQKDVSPIPLEASMQKLANIPTKKEIVELQHEMK